MEIIQLTPSSPVQYFDAAALLHINEIHHGVLPLLGKKFLSRLYCELSRTQHTGVWAALNQKEIIGFISGCADIKFTYRALLKCPAVIGAALRGSCLTFPRLIGKLFAVLKYPYVSGLGKTDGADPHDVHAELLALAVHPDYRNYGIGGMLVKTLEKNLALWNGTSFYRVSTEGTDEISNKFYKTLNFVPVTTTRLHTLNLAVYVKKITVCS